MDKCISHLPDKDELLIGVVSRDEFLQSAYQVMGKSDYITFSQTRKDMRRLTWPYRNE